MPWLTKTNPKIDWVNCQLTIHQGHYSILLHAIDSPMGHVISALQFARLTKTCKYYLAMIRTLKLIPLNKPTMTNLIYRNYLLSIMMYSLMISPMDSHLLKFLTIILN